MCIVCNQVRGNLKWNVCDGKETLFWKDAWLPGGIAIDQVQGISVPPEEASFSVDSYIPDSG